MKRKIRFAVKVAGSYIGRYVNLHLRDGSVIINVLVTRVQRGKPSILRYKTPMKRVSKIPLEEIDFIRTVLYVPI